MDSPLYSPPIVARTKVWAKLVSNGKFHQPLPLETMPSGVRVINAHLQSVWCVRCPLSDCQAITRAPWARHQETESEPRAQESRWP